MLPLLLIVVPSVSAHGGIVWPPIWQDGIYTPLEDRYDIYVYSNPKVTDPNTGDEITSTKSWLTDQAYTGGQGDEFIGVGEIGEISNRLVLYDNRCRTYCQANRNPWAYPGVAPSLGGGCGIFGGNPYGCPNYQDDRAPGSVCGQDPPIGRGSRGTWAFGTSALEIDFPAAAVTSWPLGSTQEVTWVSKASHWGGYTYRLCKLPDEGKTGITEECFAQNILEFATSYTMVRETAADMASLGAWTQFDQEDRSNGTYPEGSVWRPVGITGDGYDETGLFRKDEVLVPSNLEVGQYVLSLRWDAALVSQVTIKDSNIVCITTHYHSSYFDIYYCYSSIHFALLLLINLYI